MNGPLTSAFPSELTPDVTSVATTIAPSSYLNASEPFVVSCAGETIQIPYRIYNPVITEWTFASVSPNEQLVVACWFTRHHDGRVRERFLRSFRAFDSALVISYVVPLCGEYVIEILDYIWQRHTAFDTAILRQWLLDNPRLYSRTRSRIVSYWNCYYRHSCPRFKDYVGSQLIDFFDANLQDS